MTDTEATRTAQRGTVPTDVRKPREQAGKPLLAAGLVLLLAVSVLMFVRSYSGALPLWGLVILGVLAFSGLVVLVGLIAGFVHFGRMPRQRAFFDSLINGLGEACMICDKNGHVIYSNDDYRDMVDNAGFSRLVAMDNLYAGYPDISGHIYRLSQMAREKQSGAEEFRLAAGSSAAGAQPDRPSWFRLSVAPVGASLGRQYIMWRLKDISGERADQESAFSHLQYIINYLDHAPAGFFSTRANGKIAYINATLASWLGLDVTAAEEGEITLSDIVGKKDAALISDLHPRPQETTTAVFDVDLKPENGKVIPVRILHLTDFDQNGRPQPSRSLVLDRRMGNIDRDGSGDDLRFTRLMNNSPLGIVELSLDGKITGSNSAFVEASSGKLGIGGKLSDLLTNQDDGSIVDAIMQASENDGSPIMVNVAFKNDKERKATLVIVRLDLESEKADSVFAFVVDTTKHLSLEEQLAQSQKMQAVGQLAGGVAHDFNNVLTAIIGFSDLLLAKHRPSDPSFADIMNIKQNANRAANLVRQLLAFSRRQTLRPQVMLLSDVLSDLGNLLGRLLGETVELKVMHGRDLWPVKVDINQFEQVVINLCVNARDAMNNKGRLSIRTANISEEESASIAPSIMSAGEYVLCEVSDTGSGMPAEVIEKIYEPFFSTKDVGKGTGLGLSTVYGIVKQTGGFIFCDSEVGKGTTFSIYLPRHIPRENEAEEAHEDVKDVDAGKADMTGNGMILLVEDEDAVRAFASRALETRGFTVVQADCGEAALAIVEDIKDEIQLVLSDVVMPEMDGPTMLKEMRKRGINTKFIFISGYAEDAFEKNLEGEHDFAFLPKPFSLKQLTEAVKDAMQS